jgi:hypothetical protein
MTLADLQAQADAALADLRAANDALYAERRRVFDEEYGIRQGDLVTQEGVTYRVTGIDFRVWVEGKPMLIGHPRREDGSFGGGFHPLTEWTKEDE